MQRPMTLIVFLTFTIYVVLMNFLHIFLSILPTNEGVAYMSMSTVTGVIFAIFVLWLAIMIFIRRTWPLKWYKLIAWVYIVFQLMVIFMLATQNPIMIHDVINPNWRDLLIVLSGVQILLMFTTIIALQMKSTLSWLEA